MCHACTMCAIRVQAMCTRGSCACTLRVRLPVQRVCNMCAQCLCIWVNSHTARVASLRVPGVQHTCARCSACVCMPVPVCEACARALCPTRGRAGLRHWLMQSVRGRHPPPRHVRGRARPCEAPGAVRGGGGRHAWAPCRGGCMCVVCAACAWCVHVPLCRVSLRHACRLRVQGAMCVVGHMCAVQAPHTHGEMCVCASLSVLPHPCVAALMALLIPLPASPHVSPISPSRGAVLAASIMEEPLAGLGGA